MADGSLQPETLGRLMAELRPRLHRYCARMVGSAVDGEDVIQEALAKAAEAFPSAGRIERPESWLFRIAHNAALDALRRRKRHAAVRSDIGLAGLADASAAADARFNARDFDALRDLLAEDVRLDLVNRTRLAGRKDVSVYFSRYDEVSDWRFSPGLAEGRPALLVSDPADAAGAVGYVVLLDWADGRIAAIRDFRYATYVTESLTVSRL